MASGSLVLDWTATTGIGVESSPAVANGVVYIGANDNKLYAFDAAGTANCSHSPTTCTPLWTATMGNYILSSPAVANGVVYVVSLDGYLSAFDAAGTKNCSGVPKTCTPLWTVTSGVSGVSSLTVANGVVYAVSATETAVEAFDAAGTTNCSGVPKTCAPLWTAAIGVRTSASPAVANGVVVIGTANNNVTGTAFAFDAAGTTNCSGTPKACTPLWTATTGPADVSSPAIVNGVVYVGSRDDKLYAFDAAGTTNCSGTPTTCTPLWTDTTGGAIETSPAVANGVVYVHSDDSTLYAFDAAGTTNCSSTPKTCAPLWTAASGVTSGFGSSPAVANGVLYLGSYDGKLYAFDAAGTTNCSSTPKTCAPLWTATVTAGGYVSSSPAVANGKIYIGSGLPMNGGGKLSAFGLEKVPPTTSIVQPANAATLSATATLAASASDDVSVSKVEYHLTGGSYNDTLIGTATPYACCGWVYNWNTTTVPNDTYTLTSVATDPAGNVGHSANVTITVQN